MRQTLLFLNYLTLICLLTACTPKYYQQVEPDLHKDRYVDQLEQGSELLNETFTTTKEKTTEGTFVFKQFYPETYRNGEPVRVQFQLPIKFRLE